MPKPKDVWNSFVTYLLIFPSKVGWESSRADLSFFLGLLWRGSGVRKGGLRILPARSAVSSLALLFVQLPLFVFFRGPVLQQLRLYHSTKSLNTTLSVIKSTLVKHYNVKPKSYWLKIYVLQNFRRLDFNHNLLYCTSFLHVLSMHVHVLNLLYRIHTCILCIFLYTVYVIFLGCTNRP